MKFHVTDKITNDMTVVVTRVEDFDESSNDLWKIEGNKSYAREGMICKVCKKPVVMSNFAFGNNPTPEQILCGKCFLSLDIGSFDGFVSSATAMSELNKK